MQVRFYHFADVFTFFNVPVQDLVCKDLRKFGQVNLVIVFKSLNLIV